jgi:hypothetical protein
MKPQSISHRARAAFTITEVAVVSTLMTLVLGSIIALSMFSLRVGSGANRQMELDSQARVVNLMVSEIKSAQEVVVQNYNGTTLTSIPIGQPIVGNALKLVIENDNGTTKEVIYWVDNDGDLFRTVVNGSGAKLWINDITSSTPFSAKDFAGNVLTTPSQRMIVDIRLTALDSNQQNFKQTVTRHVTVMKRN